MVFHYEEYNQNLCFECQFLHNFFEWCKRCKLNHFQLNYKEFSSGNYKIDIALKDNYCESKTSEELIKWIPYNEFKDITHIVNEESSKWYSAVWSNGYICNWNKDKFNWNRQNRSAKNLEVTLITFENVDDLLNYVHKVS